MNSKIKLELFQNETKLNQELINEIDPEIMTKYNSVNVFLRRAGSGKSFNILTAFVKLAKCS